MSASVAVDLGRGAAAGPWKQFRWDNVALIRARMDAAHGRKLKGLQISVRGREGEAWKVIYRKP